MAAGYDIGASASTAISSQSGAAQSGTGDFNFNAGGGKQSVTLYIVLGVVAVIGLFLWLNRRK